MRVSQPSSSGTKAGWRLVPSDALRAAPFHIFGDGSDRGSGASCKITPSVKVTKNDPYATHVAMLDQYTDKQIHDVVAFLETLK